jgi:hypothetical protein
MAAGVQSPGRIFADRMIACWTLARTSRLFLLCLASFPVILAMWIAGVPDGITATALRLLLLISLVAISGLTPAYRTWAKSAPPLGLTGRQRALIVVVILGAGFGAILAIGFIVG